MAFNVEEKGGEVAIIKENKEDDIIVYLDPNFEKKDDNKIKGLKKNKINYLEKIDLNKDQKFYPYPDTSKERQCLLIVGQSGSGKSWYLNEYFKNYKKAYKNKRPIYFFSNIDEDKSINEKLIKRVVLDDSWKSEPLSCDDIGKDGALCAFDDIEMIKDKDIRNEVFKFINEILTTGRHFKISCALIVHYANNKPYLRDFLNEAHSYTYFPQSANRATNYLLENYMGVDSKEIKKIKKLGSRWITVFKNYPQCILGERNLFKLSDMDD
jgi:GTPase SAR1 family protein